MTLAKRLLLGSAAAVVATTGAQAADLGLPVAPAVDYVQICTIGSFTGFLLPGSDVCFDINGFARWQVTLNQEADPGTPAQNGAGDFGGADDYDMIGAFELNFDARTMTEWGLLRGFIRLDSEGEDDPVDVDFEKGFIQIGGLTAGLTDSFFDPVFTDYALGPIGDTPGTDDLALIGYSYSVGNGVTIMASLENNEARNTAIGVYTVALGASATAFDALDTVTLTTAGSTIGYDESATMPDFVAAIRVDQAWGSAKLSGALHELDPAQPAIDSEFGFAIGASAEFNLPVGVDSEFGIYVNYADGAVSYVGLDTSVANTGLPFVDALILDGSTNIETTQVFGVGAGVEFGINTMLDWELDAFYNDVDHAGGSTLDGNVWAVRTSLAWTPITNLEIRGGVAYQQFDFDNNLNAAGVVTSVTGADDDQFAARLRITRSF